MPDRVALAWLVSLRWLEVACAAVLVLAVHLLVGPLPLASLLGLVALAAMVNLWLAWRLKNDQVPGERGLAAVVLVDVVVLTGMLAASGGAHNPFAALYLFEVMIAALVLRPAWAAAVSAVGGIAYGTLFLDPPHVHDMSQMQRHLVGMWVAYGVAAPFVALAVHRLRQSLAAADRAVEDSRRRADRSERLASLATLAAGAAHEIANPLGTIAVVAGDWVRAADPRIAEDGRLLQREIGRCRAVLDQLAAGAGAGTGEAPRPLDVARVVEEARAWVDAVEGSAGSTRILAPPGLLGQAVRRLVDNARDAGGTVRLVVDPRPGEVHLVVRDTGAGMAAEVAARASEPFFSTKVNGMGLGMYFARSVVEHVGGRMEVVSTPGTGTDVRLVIPVLSP
ncbi:MAG: HAMP domain-containing sensor histidine kinase [Myxococcota bacterium]